MGVPVVATNVGGTSEIIEHMTSGILVRPSILDELTLAIQNVIDEPEKHKAMSQIGQSYVRNNFNHNSRVNRITEIYEDMTIKQVPEH
jgi:glycosyltransferase involved in cell wall biosynthesis